MRVLLQRVSEARVEVDGDVVGAMDRGYVLFIGIGPDDTQAIATRMAEKIVGLRLFPNEAGKFDHALLDPSGDDSETGSALVVSQFTLYGSTRRGRRPDFTGAAPPDLAAPLCDFFAAELRRLGVPVATGRFGADMNVHLINDGPVTLWLDSDTM